MPIELVRYSRGVVLLRHTTKPKTASDARTITTKPGSNQGFLRRFCKGGSRSRTEGRPFRGRVLDYFTATQALQSGAMTSFVSDERRQDSGGRGSCRAFCAWLGRSLTLPNPRMHRPRAGVSVGFDLFGDRPTISDEVLPGMAMPTT